MNTRFTLSLVQIVLAVCLAGPLLAQQSVPALSPVPQADAEAKTFDTASYAVGATDTIKVTVFKEPELSGSYRIDLDGTITYPMLGRLQVGGKTVQAIEEQIGALLRDGYVRHAQVSVEIEQFRSRSIFIMGEVRTPGKYPLQGDVTLLEVLALAGSPTDSAGSEIVVLRPRERLTRSSAPALPEDGQSAEVTRVNLIDLQQGRIATNLFLEDGDTVYIPAASRFYVTGHVRSPGSFVLPAAGITVQQAIALAGGLTERGSNRGIKIRREVKPNVFEEIKVELTDKVQANDTVIIRQRYL